MEHIKSKKLGRKNAKCNCTFDNLKGQWRCVVFLLLCCFNIVNFDFILFICNKKWPNL